MNEILDLLRQNRISCRICRHPAVHTIGEMNEADIPDRELIPKNLFLRDDRKRGYYLVTVRNDRKIDLKQLRTAIGSRPLSFASEKDLQEILGLAKGAVTPFGLLNDRDRKVSFYLDSFFASKEIGIHPNDNTMTVFLRTEDLLSILRDHCNSISFIGL